MTSLDHIQSTLTNLMYGHNYMVTFGSDVFENCRDENEFRRQFKDRYAESKAEDAQLILMNEQDVWSAINFGLNYRGDHGAGLKLSEEKERELSIVQTSYREVIQNYIAKADRIYSYPEDFGLPFFPIFWGYQFVLFLNDGNCVFIYAASSD